MTQKKLSTNNHKITRKKLSTNNHKITRKRASTNSHEITLMFLKVMRIVSISKHFIIMNYEL